MLELFIEYLSFLYNEEKYFGFFFKGLNQDGYILYLGVFFFIMILEFRNIIQLFMQFFFVFYFVNSERVKLEFKVFVVNQVVFIFFVNFGGLLIQEGV